MNLSFVEMLPVHVAAVAALEARSNPTPWSESLIAAEFDVSPEARHWLVALRANEVVGFGGLMFVGDDAHLMNLAVSPEERRQGIARRLVHELVDACVDRGVKNLTLEVRASNAGAIRLYEDCGLHSVGQRPGYYEDGEAAVIMWRYNLDAELDTEPPVETEVHR